MELELCNVSCGYGKKEVLRNVDLCFKTGEFTCVLGANGIGKTTLFKTILGFVHPLNGAITIDGKDISLMGSSELARYISYVPQAKSNSYQYTVEDTVMMGRASYIRKFSKPTDNDVKIVWDVLNKLGISNLAGSVYSALSGGEQQVVLVARALAQEAKFIVMDEPASNLDFENQKRVLDILHCLSERDIGVVMSSHSPDHALYCDAHVIMIRRDKTILRGSTDEVLSEDNLKDVYGVDISILQGQGPGGAKLRACRLSQ